LDNVGPVHIPTEHAGNEQNVYLCLELPQCEHGSGQMTFTTHTHNRSRVQHSYCLYDL